MVDCFVKSHRFSCVIVGDPPAGVNAFLRSYILKEIYHDEDSVLEQCNENIERYTTHIKSLNLQFEAYVEFIALNELIQLNKLVLNSDSHIIFVLCFSIGDYDTYEDIDEFWFDKLVDLTHQVPNVILIGTQTQYRNASYYITQDEGLKLASRMQALDYYECSLFNIQRIDAIFQNIISKQFELNHMYVSRWNQPLIIKSSDFGLSILQKSKSLRRLCSVKQKLEPITENDIHAEIALMDSYQQSSFHISPSLQNAKKVHGELNINKFQGSARCIVDESLPKCKHQHDQNEKRKSKKLKNICQIL